MGGDGEKNWSVANMRQLVEGRGGGSGLWQLEGRLVALGTGRQLARLSGVEEVVITQPVRKLPQSKSVEVKRLANSDSIHPNDVGNMQVTIPPITHDAVMLIRHSLFYKQNNSDSVMRTFRFRPTSPARPVSPILPSASSVRVALDDDGSAKLTRTFIIDDPLKSKRARRKGEQEDTEGKLVASAKLSVGTGGSLGVGLRRMLCASWSFIGRRVRAASGAPALPGVVEQCDYVLGRRDGVWHWSRVGRCPPWYGRGQCVTYLDARKVPAWHMLDENLRALLRGAGRVPLRTEMALKSARNPNDLDSEDDHHQSEPSELVATNSGNVNQKSGAASHVHAPQAKHERRRKILGVF